MNSVEIPARSESLLPVIIPREYLLQTSIIEPVLTMNKKSLLMAKLLVKPDRHTTFCSALNLTNQSKFLKRGTVIATITSAVPHHKRRRKYRKLLQRARNQKI
jgi:hypothetical protein